MVNTGRCRIDRQDKRQAGRLVRARNRGLGSSAHLSDSPRPSRPVAAHPKFDLSGPPGRPGLFVCGEYSSLSGIQWALLSGGLVAGYLGISDASITDSAP